MCGYIASMPSKEVLA
nr:hypothetical protein 3.5 [Burkholderia phage Bups phi1]